MWLSNSRAEVDLLVYFTYRVYPSVSLFSFSLSFSVTFSCRSCGWVRGTEAGCHHRIIFFILSSALRSLLFFSLCLLSSFDLHSCVCFVFCFVLFIAR
ncbi:hypothetical protein BZA77DRAFT_101850 [Pyronema omphalodes]|nr:hypothetical protein BZA77DRAFT_101850 [Pyronema omphalodes]